MLVNFHFWHSLVNTTSLALERKEGEEGGDGRKKRLLCVHIRTSHKSLYSDSGSKQKREDFSSIQVPKSLSFSLSLSLSLSVAGGGGSWKKLEKEGFFHFPPFLTFWAEMQTEEREKTASQTSSPTPPTSLNCVPMPQKASKKCNPPDFPHKFRNCLICEIGVRTSPFLLFYFKRKSLFLNVATRKKTVETD